MSKPALSALVVLLVGAAGLAVLNSCASAQPAPNAAAPVRPAPPASSGNEPASQSAGQSVPDGGASGSREIEVAGRAPTDNTIQVTATSDLPPSIPSTSQPFVRVIDTAVAPILSAMMECLRPMGPGRWSYHVSAMPNGRLIPRPPQVRAMPDQADRCADALVRGTLVNPPPPIEVPYNIYVTVAP